MRAEEEMKPIIVPFQRKEDTVKLIEREINSLFKKLHGMQGFKLKVSDFLFPPGN